MNDAETHFRAVAPRYMRQLMADFPQLNEMDAAAIFGNLGHESNGLTTLQEQNPTVAGSRGGWGWAQWTGPRRRAFEDYCTRNHKDPKADDTNYAYLWLELKGDEKRSITALKAATTLDEKVVAFESSFLRSGIKHYDKRQAWAKIAFDALRASAVPAVDPAPTPPQPIPSPPAPPVQQRPVVSWGVVFWIGIAVAIAAIGAIVIFWRF